jgi:hypothetical protein
MSINSRDSAKREPFSILVVGTFALVLILFVGALGLCFGVPEESLQPTPFMTLEEVEVD